MARTPWPMRDGLDVIERGRDAFPAGQFAGMDGDAEPGLARDLEGAHIVLDLADPLVAGHAEAGDQRMAAARGEPCRLLRRPRRRHDARR